MSDYPPLTDLIILALIAAFILLRLRAVLGQRPEQNSPEQNLTNSGQNRSSSVVSLIEHRKGVAALMAADPSFDPDGFLHGAQSAFVLIVNAFSQGDLATLRPLVSDEVYINFVKALEQQSMEQVHVVGMTSADILEAALMDARAVITVKFVSDQELRGQVSRVVDIWTFQRAIRSPDPTWILVATRSGQDGAGQDGAGQDGPGGLR